VGKDAWLTGSWHMIAFAARSAVLIDLSAVLSVRYLRERRTLPSDGLRHFDRGRPGVDHRRRTATTDAAELRPACHRRVRAACGPQPRELRLRMPVSRQRCGRAGIVLVSDGRIDARRFDESTSRARTCSVPCERGACRPSRTCTSHCWNRGGILHDHRHASRPRSVAGSHDIVNGAGGHTGIAVEWLGDTGQGS
jgi:hypothetical protein